jgi:hypothetical protein
VDIDPQRLSTALQQLYSATIEPTDRARLPNNLAAAFGATSCLVYTIDDAPLDVTVVGGAENMTAFLPAYGEHYHALDLWARHAMRRPNQIFLGQELVSEEELLRTEIYSDCLRPTDGAPLSLMIVLLPPATDPSNGVEPLAAVFASQGQTRQAFSPSLRRAKKEKAQRDSRRFETKDCDLSYRPLSRKRTFSTEDKSQNLPFEKDRTIAPSRKVSR